MVNNIAELPDDIISHIFSFLSIRDTLRARLSSPKWLNLPDSRSTVVLDEPNIFGKDDLHPHMEDPAVQSKYVKIVQCFMKIWAGKRISTLEISFNLGKEHYREIESWIARAVKTNVEDLKIYILGHEIFPCTTTTTLNARLYLHQCTLSFTNSGWLCNLTTLYLRLATLDRATFDLILSKATNLVSLELLWCVLPQRLRIDDGQLRRLKRLFIADNFEEVRLNCPCLKFFGHIGWVASLRFVNVPLLREVKISHTRQYDPCFLLFENVDIQAPDLEALTLTINKPISPFGPELARLNLKKVNTEVSGGFNLLSVKNLLNACPCLEKLHIRMVADRGSALYQEMGRRQYQEESYHHKLKKVEFEHFDKKWNALELEKYLLRNAVVLEEMIIVTARYEYDYVRQKFESVYKLQEQNLESLQKLQEEIKPNTRLHIEYF